MHTYNLFLSALMVTLVGCATQSSSQEVPKAKPELEAKIQAEPPATSSEEIARRGAQAFINAPGLTDDQKKRLMEVFNRTYASAMEIKGEIGKSKSLMFELVASKNVKSKEVQDLRKHIVALDQKRLDVMFKSLTDVQNIVGTGSEKEEIYKHFYDFEYPNSVYGRK